MANETVTQSDIEAAIARLSNVQGILMCATKVLDQEIVGSPIWAVSEALHAAVGLVSDSYCMLYDNDVVLAVKEA